MTFARRVQTRGGGGTGLDVEPEPEPDPITVIHAWVGNVSTTGATVKARSTDATSVTLRYSTDPGLAGYSTAAGSEGSDDVWTCTLSGLTANTQYYFGFAGADLTGKLRTFPSGAASFTIAASGDSGNAPDYPGAAETSNTPAFDRIRDRDPLLFIHLGDLHYRNLNTTNVATYRTAYKDVIANARFAQLIRECPTAYVWDDHDYGPNDSDGTYTGKAAAQQAYRDYVPHWTVPAASIYQTFVIGRVRFILLDIRSERTANTATDDAAKTRLGATQKQWLKDTLLAATEPCIVLEIGSWWGTTVGFADGWESFSTERQELAEYFEDNDLTSRLLLLGADIHELAGDDGTNTQFDPGAVTDGPPYVQFAPLDAAFTNVGGTFTHGPYQTRKQMYGTIAFTDTGTQITAVAKGWALSVSPGATETEVFSLSKVYG